MSSAESTSPLRNQADTTLDEIKALLREAEQTLSRAGDNASDEVQDLRERLRGVLADGQAKVKDVAAAARRQAARADEAIRANPYQAIGIAAGVGLLAGYLISRSCNNRN